METPATVPEVKTSSRMPYFLFGVLIFLLGPVLYVGQVMSGKFVTPWFIPALGTVGVLLMALSVSQRGGMFRIVGASAFLLLVALEWYFVGVAIRTPNYTGPATPGRQLPAFASFKADGAAFTQSDMVAASPAIALFFRGRW